MRQDQSLGGGALGGANRRTVDNIRATADPTTTDDSSAGYHVGSLWYRPATGEMWTCTDATATAAVWLPRWGQFASPRNRFYTFTDCIGPAGNNNAQDADWTQSFSGTGALVGSQISVGSLNAFGIWDLQSGTTTSGRSCIGPCGPFGQATAIIRFGLGRARFQCKRRPRPIRKDLEGRIATRWRHGLQIR